MTILEDAQKGIVTDEMRTVARLEGVTEDFIRRGMASGRIVIPISPYRDVKLCGIGEGLRTKVNASVGTSSDIVDVEMEVEKTRQAERAGADSIMELSTGGDFQEIRRRVIEATSLSVGSVPLYQAFIEAARKDGAVVHMDPDDLFRITAEQARMGTNFMAIHTGINRETMTRLRNQGRHGGLVSRGGAFMTAWMIHNDAENPLYSEFDYLLEILKEHDVTLSFGNGMRAGAVHDATDRAQIQELIINAELADRAEAYGVQSIIEGPGHIPIDEIEANVVVQKRLTGGRPFYMLGPLVTDIAPGYDDRVAAIGMAQISSAMSLPPNTWHCPPPMKCMKGLSAHGSRPMQGTWSSWASGTVTCGWGMHDAISTGSSSSRSRSIRLSPERYARNGARRTIRHAPCAAITVH